MRALSGIQGMANWMSTRPAACAPVAGAASVWILPAGMPASASALATALRAVERGVIAGERVAAGSRRRGIGDDPHAAGPLLVAAPRPGDLRPVGIARLRRGAGEVERRDRGRRPARAPGAAVTAAGGGGAAIGAIPAPAGPAAAWRWRSPRPARRQARAVRSPGAPAAPAAAAAGRVASGCGSERYLRAFAGSNSSGCGAGGSLGCGGRSRLAPRSRRPAAARRCGSRGGCGAGAGSLGGRAAAWRAAPAAAGRGGGVPACAALAARSAIRLCVSFCRSAVVVVAGRRRRDAGEVRIGPGLGRRRGCGERRGLPGRDRSCRCRDATRQASIRAAAAERRSSSAKHGRPGIRPERDPAAGPQPGLRNAIREIHPASPPDARRPAEASGHNRIAVY